MTQNARATSFATLKDLVAFIKCKAQGGSDNHCFNYGDNGEGAWGDTTAQLSTPMCALHGVGHRGDLVKVTIGNKSVVCELRDRSPEGVCDLNPAALVALGFPSDCELDQPCTFEFV